MAALTGVEDGAALASLCCVGDPAASSQQPAGAHRSSQDARENAQRQTTDKRRCCTASTGIHVLVDRCAVPRCRPRLFSTCAVHGCRLAGPMHDPSCGRTSDEAPSDSVQRCMHHAETLRFSRAARFTVSSSSASRSSVSHSPRGSQRSRRAPRGRHACTTCTRTPVAAAGLAGRGRVRAHGGRAGVRAWHLRTVRRTAVFSRDELRPESNMANCLFHQCRS